MLLLRFYFTAFFFYLISSSLAFANTITDIKAKVMVGDLIFIQSQSSQADAVQAAQYNSPWTHVGIIVSNNNKFYVAEDIQPVGISSIENLISRSKQNIVVIKRLKSNDFLDINNQKKLFANLEKFYKKNYDTFFEWDDTKIYCSELVYKSFLSTLNIYIGNLVTVRDLNYQAPEVQDLIKRRYEKSHRTINWEELLNEKIVTPDSQFNDDKLITIYDNQNGFF